MGSNIDTASSIRLHYFKLIHERALKWVPQARFGSLADKSSRHEVQLCPLLSVVSIDRRNTLSLREKMGCSDGSEVSSRVFCGREDRVMGSLATGRVAQGDWASVW
jgi:hypothetical protein